MTITTTENKTLMENLLTIISRREAWKKEGIDIDKLESIYRDELSQIQKQMHTQADGKIILISSMDDQHLMNTVKLILNRHKWDYKQIPRVYLNEMKQRTWMVEKLIAYTPIMEQSTIQNYGYDDDDEEPIYVEDPRGFL